ncbi:hypothetical protein QN277_022193 [Acacia crassicarpa]|uniref:NAC domain-containing protein n=1 Tax=Acacia crassicarpa TaxID=499986 RepID=A0AAE1JEG2_9FABA|nr:hypothetical protein QN277_022193 [Acacia crassicarpa]
MANVALVLESMPVGFRFRPTDEELVNHYLTNKLIGDADNLDLQIIPEIDVCKNEPWDIPAFSMIKSDDPEWFFFSPRDYKYSNSTRSNRATMCGFWKSTGKDRNIKVRGSNEVIGTKKTLVFYRGRVPNGVKTHWVIHEYHAVTFPSDQRTFVLCKLMKKHEKAEGRTGDEGEPSNFMPSDCEIVPSEGRIPDVHPFPQNNLESMFQTQESADEYDLSFFPSSPIVNEQEFFFPRNNDSSVNVPFETTEEEDNFVNSLLVDDEEKVYLNRMIAPIHSPTLAEPSGVYWESSDTDAEVVSAQYGYIPETSIKSYKNDGPREILLLSKVNSSELPSNREAKQERKGRSFQDDFDSSSADSTPARPFRINRVKHVASASTSKTWKTQYQPRSAASLSLRAGARRSQAHRKISTKEAYHEAQKETPVHSNNNKREAQVTDKRSTSKSPRSESSGVNGRNTFIQLETPSSSQNLSSPSVYLGNVVIGLVLFVVIIWEMLSCGKFF